MKKELTEEKRKELLFKYQWCEVIIQWLKQICDNKDEKESLEDDLRISKDTYEDNDIRGMRSLYNDTNEMCGALRVSEQLELNRILRERFGQDLTTVNNRLGKKADSIIKRSKIRNDEEYYQMKPYVDHLLWTGVAGDEEKARELDKLFYEYEQRVAAKMEKANKRKEE
ncbi:MAG: hypothetical protein HDR88_13865 [Bacteroides sp.]|nr:hypothetical protein [Bacteroides sp.]